MAITNRLVTRRQSHLKWRAFDILELTLMGLCGILLFAFCSTVIFDIITRTIGRPWLWLQEVTSTFFIYAIFFGAAVATRRNDHLYLTAIAEGLRGKFRTAVEVFTRLVVLGVAVRSEERRVGKERRCRGVQAQGEEEEWGERTRVTM